MINIKTELKRIYAKTKLSFSVGHRYREIGTDEAYSILEDTYPRGEISIYRQNSLNYKYDLMVIIPAHNVEKYVQECIDSVLEQKTHYSVGVYIVENSSTDGTKNQLEKYNGLENVFVISLNGSGLSLARNYLLSEISGEYIMFIDSDDILPENSIERLMNKAREFDADIVEGNVRSFSDNGRILKETHFLDSKNVSDVSHVMLGQAWAKVFKATLFGNLIFPENYLYEDSILTYCVYPNAKKKYHISDLVYLYRRNETGIVVTSKGTKKSIQTLWLSFYLWEELLKNNPMSDDMYINLLEQIRLNQDRIEGNDEKVELSAFIISKDWLERINYRYSGEMDKMFKCLEDYILDGDYNKFKIITRYWDSLKD